MHITEASLAVTNGIFHYLHDVFSLQMIKLEDLAAGEKCGVDIEERVFDSRRYQDYVAFFDIGQKRVLLEFVEAVDLIKKQDGTDAHGLSVLCRLYNLSKIIETSCRGVKPLEAGLSSCCYHLRKRRLARPRRPVEDQRCDSVCFNSPSEEFVFTYDMFLPGIFV